MLLLAMRGRNFILRNQHTNTPYQLFGFYLKLTPPILCNPGLPQQLETTDDLESTHQQLLLMDIASQELVLSLIESLIEELRFCVSEHLITCNAITEATLVRDLNSIIFDGTSDPVPRLFSEIQDLLGNLHAKIAEFIRRKFTYREEVTVPIATLDLRILRKSFLKIREYIDNLRESNFVVLLDEYENLRPEYQRIVNTIIKLSAPEFSVKVAKKIGIADVAGTTIGQELQENHDYQRITLVYDVQSGDQFPAYCSLLETIVHKILANANLRYANIETFLPQFLNPNVSPEEVRPFLDTLLIRRASREDPTRAAKPPIPDAYYRHAATYRALHEHRRRTQFSGMKTLAFLSSGVIRYFQEIVGVAFYLNVSSLSGDSISCISLSPESQSRAVHVISEHTLTTLSKNVETHGDSLKHLLLDLGSFLRHKLLTHSSEPEAGRLTIENPEVLTDDGYSTLLNILDLGVREGVFQTREGRPAFRPKHRSDPEPVEFNISRILAPVLELSPRLRWRTTVRAEVLRDLVIPTHRSAAMKELYRSIGRTNSRHDSDQTALF